MVLLGRLLWAVVRETELWKFLFEAAFVCIGSYYAPWTNPIFVATLAVALLSYYFFVVSKIPVIHDFDSREPSLQMILSKIRCFHTTFYPSPLVLNTSAECIYLLFGRPAPRTPVEWKQEIVPKLFTDGENCTLHWSMAKEPVSSTAPVIVFFHGLSNGTRELHVHYFAKALNSKGWHVVCIVRRGCGPKGTITLPKQYAGDLDDTKLTIEYIAAKMRGHPLYGFGISAGAMCMEIYLAITGKESHLRGAFSVGTPWSWRNTYEFAKNRPLFDYVMTFAKKRDIFNRHVDVLLHHPLSPIRDTFPGVDFITSFIDYHKHITMRLHGYSDLDAFYEKQGSQQLLAKVAKPIVFLQADDDRIMPPSWIPHDIIRSNPNIALVTTTVGGHCGHAEGLWPFTDRMSWLDRCACEVLDAIISETATVT